MTAIDQTNDLNGAQLAHYTALYPLPEFVKQADTQEVFGELSEKLADNQFADRASKTFPCHTKAATWASALHFFNKQAAIEPDRRLRIHRALEKFAAYWTILPEFCSLRNQVEAQVKTAKELLPDSEYLAVVDYENDTRERFQPLRTTMEIKQAAEWMKKYRQDFKLVERVKMANRLLDKAEELGTTLDDMEYFERQAGRAIGNMAEIKQAFEQRTHFFKDAEQRKTWQAGIAALDDLKADIALDPAIAIKLAETLDKADRELGLTGGYGELLKRPEEVVFATTFSKAAESIDQHVSTQSNRIYNKEEFKKLATPSLESLFGTEFVNSVVDEFDGKVSPDKLAEHLAALPRDDAEQFDLIAAEAGIAPVMKKKASIVDALADHFKK